MMIQYIDRMMLADRGRKISVSIIDSGFSRIPAYAVLHGRNPMPSHVHGNRVLSIFTAPDSSYPIAGLELHLACHVPNGGYASLERALSLLPRTDILSMSLSWGDDIPELRGLLLSKAGLVFAPFTNGTRTPYPSSYDGVVSCSDKDERGAMRCVRPVAGWNGKSYAVPAAARLAAYSTNLLDGDTGEIRQEDRVLISDLFSQAGAKSASVPAVSGGMPVSCRSCKRTLRNPDHTPMSSRPAVCPYCGMTP